MFLTSLKQTCNEYLIKFSENQSAPKLENRKTSPCSPCAPNLLHVLVSRIPGYHNLCSPVWEIYYVLEMHCIAMLGVAWYSMVLRGIAWYCIVLHGTALYCMVLQGNAWYCMILYGIDLYYIVLNSVYNSE